MNRPTKPQRPSQTHARQGLAISAPTLLLLVGSLGACSPDPFAMDRRIDRVLSSAGERTATLGTSPREGAAVALSTPTQLQTEPETTNPQTGELAYAPAAEARDVAARLDAYARAGGIGEESSATALTLDDALRQAQRTGRELMAAQDQYVLAAISLLIERHAWGPRFFNDTTTAVDGGWDDGAPEGVASLINQLRVTRRLPSGGSAEAAWVWNASEQLRERASGRYEQSSQIVLRGNVPLLRGAGSVAREDLIQAERDLVYAAREFERFRRSYLVAIASDYFALIEARSSITNQERQLEALRKLNESTKARADAGRLDAFQTALTLNRVRSAESQLAGLRERYILQLERFKVRLGLDPGTPIALSPEVPMLPDPEASLEDAAMRALEYRLDLQNARDRLDDRRRALDNAKNDTLPDLSLEGRVGLPTDPGDPTGGLGFSADDTEYRVGATLSLPLDRDVERLGVRRALIELERSARDLDRQRDEVVIAVKGALRNVELARFQLQLAEEQVEINRRRLRGQELRSDVIEPQTLVDTQNDLLQAENDRDRATTNLRVAVLQYLLQSDQLRVAREGTLERLPGM